MGSVAGGGQGGGGGAARCGAGSGVRGGFAVRGHLGPKAGEEAEGLSTQEPRGDDGLGLQDGQGRAEEVEEPAGELAVVQELGADAGLEALTGGGEAAGLERGGGAV